MVYAHPLHRCPNPLDTAHQQTLLSGPPPPSPRGQTRRFTITTFQFLSKGKTSGSNEEVRTGGIP